MYIYIYYFIVENVLRISSFIFVCFLFLLDSSRVREQHFRAEAESHNE